MQKSKGKSCPPLSRRGIFETERNEKRQRKGKAEKRVFYPEECVVDLLRHTPGINLFEPNKREQLNSP